MGYRHACETDLSLGLDLFLNKPDHGHDHDHDQFQASHHDHEGKKESPRLRDRHYLFPCLKLGLSSEDTNQTHLQITATALLMHQQPSPLIKAVSSYSNSTVKERGHKLEEVDINKVSSMVSDEKGSSRKKLRLTKQQSAVLEDSFKEHNSLNPKQKQTLAKQLNLRARQVEVWFQNRRARTKLRQTEVDCELLKQCCEALTEENRRLKMELKALKLTPPLHMQPPASNLTVCPSCGSNCISG